MRLAAVGVEPDGMLRGDVAEQTQRISSHSEPPPMLALPGLAFIAVTFLTLCAPTLRKIYGRRLATVAVPSITSRFRPQVARVDTPD